eukprot:2043766-Rhodomonas_salina.2
MCSSDLGYAASRSSTTRACSRYKVAAYAPATRCPVLRRWRMLWFYAMSRTRTAYWCVLCVQCAVLKERMVLSECDPLDHLPRKLPPSGPPPYPWTLDPRP